MSVRRDVCAICGKSYHYTEPWIRNNGHICGPCSGASRYRSNLKQFSYCQGEGCTFNRGWNQYWIEKHGYYCGTCVINGVPERDDSLEQGRLFQ